MMFKIVFEDGASEYLAHYGIKGMKWGVWNEETKARRGGTKPQKEQSVLFVSGSSKTQDRESGYYRKKLPREVRKELKSSMKSKDKIIVGDAPGVDRQVQDYLKKKHYKDVEVYGPDIQPRYKAGKDWVFNAVNDTKSTPGSKEWLAKKDEAMTNRATKGLAVILDEGANATRNNVRRLTDQDKKVSVYELSKDGKRNDKKVNTYKVAATPYSEIRKMQRDFEKSNPTLKQAKKDLESGKITKDLYISTANQEWQKEIAKPDTKYRFVSQWGPQGGLGPRGSKNR